MKNKYDKIRNILCDSNPHPLTTVGDCASYCFVNLINKNYKDAYMYALFLLNPPQGYDEQTYKIEFWKCLKRMLAFNKTGQEFIKCMKFISYMESEFNKNYDSNLILFKMFRILCEKDDIDDCLKDFININSEIYSKTYPNGFPSDFKSPTDIQDKDKRDQYEYMQSIL